MWVGAVPAGVVKIGSVGTAHDSSTRLARGKKFAFGRSESALWPQAILIIHVVVGDESLTCHAQRVQVMNFQRSVLVAANQRKFGFDLATRSTQKQANYFLYLFVVSNGTKSNSYSSKLPWTISREPPQVAGQVISVSPLLLRSCMISANWMPQPCCCTAQRAHDPISCSILFNWQSAIMKREDIERHALWYGIIVMMR